MQKIVVITQPTAAGDNCLSPLGMGIMGGLKFLNLKVAQEWNYRQGCVSVVEKNRGD